MVFEVKFECTSSVQDKVNHAKGEIENGKSEGKVPLEMSEGSA